MEDCRCLLNCVLHLYENVYLDLECNAESRMVEVVLRAGRSAPPRTVDCMRSKS